MAVMAATVGFSHLIAGFGNRQLTELVATLADVPYTSRHATYDLRRLRRKGLIERVPHSHSAGESPCCSPRPTDGCSLLAWPDWIPGCRPTSPPAARLLLPGVNSTGPSKASLPISWWPHEKLIWP